MDIALGMVGLEACDSPFAHPLDQKVIAEMYPVRNFPTSLAKVQSETAFRPPGMGNPAGSLAGKRCDMARLLPVTIDGAFLLGIFAHVATRQTPWAASGVVGHPVLLFGGLAAEIRRNSFAPPPHTHTEFSTDLATKIAKLLGERGAGSAPLSGEIIKKLLLLVMLIILRTRRRC